MIKHLFLCSCFFINYLTAIAQNIKGEVQNSKGEALPFASVIIKDTKLGTMTNANGVYSLNLPKGDYTLIFQYLGYKSQSKTLVVGQNNIDFITVLEEQSINLDGVKIGGGNEDPAYTIMRRAIAKSQIHYLQVSAYEAKVYVRNSLLLHDFPFIFKQKIEDLGIKKGKKQVSESILNITFKQPASRIIKVIAQKKTLDNIIPSDNFLMFNFYKNNPYIVSPLSPQAFSVYKFEYLGFFEDRGLTINKIRVIPKVYGEGFWRGEIYIIEDQWNIYSLNLETIEKVNLKINQVYSPIQGVWLPINQRIDYGGSYLGLKFEATSIINPNYIAIKTNPQYLPNIKIIDEAKDGKTVQKLSKAILKEKNSSDILAHEKEITVRDLKKINKLIEKEQKQAHKKNKTDALLIRSDSVTIDSLATKRDTDFWAKARTIPLSSDDIQAYQQSDSTQALKILKKDSLKSDSLRKNWEKYILGHNFKLNDSNLKLRYEPPYTPLMGLNYNTVEGITTNLGLSLNQDKINDKPLQPYYSISTDLRYGFGNKRLSGRIEGNYNKKNHAFALGLGSYKQQFDSYSAITDYINSITTILGYNMAKIYQKDYFHVGYTYMQHKKIRFSTDIEAANHSQMNNLPDDKLLFKQADVAFTSNSPINFELPSSDFSTHQVIIWRSSLAWSPSSRYRIYNGERIYYEGFSPKFTLQYKKGMRAVAYDFLSLSVLHKFKTGWAGEMKYMAEVGNFINANKLYLMDMYHVNSLENTSNLFAHYRLLTTTSPVQITADSYYKYSTKGQFIRLHAINEFNNFLFTQIPALRIYGLKEDIFVNYLKSPVKNNYLEIGYGIDGIFRLLRLELITSFEEGKYARWGWQIGVTL